MPEYWTNWLFPAPDGDPHRPVDKSMMEMGEIVYKRRDGDFDDLGSA